ncbi:MAG: shikimate dehydrogenase [Nitrospinae bacterium]|nr:shikimate dehydrogenase [Nitrospinota bacterium]
MNNKQIQNLAVIGDPISHSLSPIIHNTAIQHLNLPYYYSALHVKKEELGNLCRSLFNSNYKGINVTVPHKVEIIKYIDELDSFAETVGAVNTILVQENGKLKGFNTDGDGFLNSIEYYFNEKATNKNIVFLGAGGAVRGVVHRTVLEKPTKIFIANRNLEKAEIICDEVRENGFKSIESCAINNKDLQEHCCNADWIINGTSLGLKENDSEVIPEDYFSAKHRVIDMIYNPPETPFLLSAKNRGAKTLNGLGMLVFQAAKAFKIWTSHQMPTEEVMKALSEKVRKLKRLPFLPSPFYQ